MAQRVEHRSIDEAAELLKENGFEGLAEAVTVLADPGSWPLSLPDPGRAV